jgi:hypothetical protein
VEWVLLVVLAAIILGIAAVALHLFLTWAGRRGWIFYRDPGRPRPHTLGLIEEIYQPSIEHVIDQEVTEATEADQAESGDPERPGRVTD